jgi:hypothetical protein
VNKSRGRGGGGGSGFVHKRLYFVERITLSRLYLVCWKVGMFCDIHEDDIVKGMLCNANAK